MLLFQWRKLSFPAEDMHPNVRGLIWGERCRWDSSKCSSCCYAHYQIIRKPVPFCKLSPQYFVMFHPHAVYKQFIIIILSFKGCNGIQPLHEDPQLSRISRSTMGPRCPRASVVWLGMPTPYWGSYTPCHYGAACTAISLWSESSPQVLGSVDLGENQAGLPLLHKDPGTTTQQYQPFIIQNPPPPLFFFPFKSWWLVL